MFNYIIDSNVYLHKCVFGNCLCGREKVICLIVFCVCVYLNEISKYLILFLFLYREENKAVLLQPHNIN